MPEEAKVESLHGWKPEDVFMTTDGKTVRILEASQAELLQVLWETRLLYEAQVESLKKQRDRWMEQAGG